MNWKDHITTLESAWQLDGFFGRLRGGNFSSVEAAEFVDQLRRIQSTPTEDLPRRFIALLWYAPLFMTWQRERVGEHGGDLSAFERASNAIAGEVERILGVP